MAEKQKPDPAIVKVAAKALADPKGVKPAEVQKMAARIMDDQKNDPDPNVRKQAKAIQADAAAKAKAPPPKVAPKPAGKKK